MLCEGGAPVVFRMRRAAPNRKPMAVAVITAQYASVTHVGMDAIPKSSGMTTSAVTTSVRT